MRKVSARRLQLIIQVLTGARPERTIIKPKEERLIKEKHIILIIQKKLRI